MPIDLGEIINLSDDAIAIIGKVTAATKKASDGGRRVTKAEGLAIAQACSELAAKILAEIAD